MEKTNNQSVVVLLPDGRKLIACDKCDDDYPGIRIEVINTNGSQDIIAWAEYNLHRNDYTPEQRLRLLLWNAIDDEPAVDMSYDTGEYEKEK